MTGSWAPTPVEPDLSADALSLARLAARHTLLPSPDVVREVGGPVFPCLRLRRGEKRGEMTVRNGRNVLLDDNEVARWALLWPHRIRCSGRIKGWQVAHLWGGEALRDDEMSYTHPANLALIAKPLAALSDEGGPFLAHLRRHASTVYGWRPAGADDPREPAGFSSIVWRYLKPGGEAWSSVNERLASSRDARAVQLRALMAGPNT